MRKFTITAFVHYACSRTHNSQLTTHNSPPQRGFTIIELLIATTVFSIVLLMTVGGILHITRQYYRSVTQARTQEVARAVLDEVGETIRFSRDDLAYQNGDPSTLIVGPEISPDNHANYLCLGAKRYTWAIDRRLTNSPAPSSKDKLRVLWVDQPTPSCNVASGPADLDNGGTIDGRELLSDNMRLTRFDIVELPSLVGSSTYRISLGVAYGIEDNLFNPVVLGDTTRSCVADYLSGQYCAVSNLTTVTNKRL